MSISEKTEKIINELIGFNERLNDIAKEVSRDRDFTVADERLDRWKSKTVRYIRQRVSEAEATRLEETQLRLFQQGDHMGNFLKEARLFQSVLQVLIEELKEDGDSIIQPEIPETSAPLMQETQRIKLPEPQRIWLESVYSKTKQGQAIDRRSLIIELRGKLPKGFDPTEIHPKLLRDQGTAITLLGIALIDPASDLVLKTNAVLEAIRTILAKNPTKQEIDVYEVLRVIKPLKGKIDLIEAEDTGINEIEVAEIFEQLSWLGTLHSSGTNYGIKGWRSIRIEDQVFEKYLEYETIEEMLEMLFPPPSLPTAPVLTDSNSNTVTIDVFLSYASANQQEAVKLDQAITRAGATAFLAKKNLTGGDDFSEEIRKALLASRELWILVTPDSLNSHWVSTEWGAAWALQKRIVPILLRCDHKSLPDRLARLHCVDFHDYDELIEKRLKNR